MDGQQVANGGDDDRDGGAGGGSGRDGPTHCVCCKYLNTFFKTSILNTNVDHVKRTIMNPVLNFF